jgi:cell division septation protein DedD
MADRLDVDARDRPVGSGSGAAGGWGRRILTALIAVAALGGFAVVVVYSYDRGTESASQQTAPIVKAREGPTRIRPEKPGGMTIPNQDKQIYDRLGGTPDTAKIERLLPPPEPVATKPPPMPEVKIPEIPISPAAGNPSAPATPATSAPPVAAPVAPKPVAAARSDKEPVKFPPKQAPPAVKVTPVETAERQMAKIVADATKSAAPVKGWRVQIASLRSEAGGQQTWTALRNKHGDLFGNLSMRLVKAEIKGKGIFYRLQAGPVADRTAASSLCQKAKARKIGCLVVRP